MPKIKINKERCKACNLCVAFCPLGHIKAGEDFNKSGYAYVEFHEQKGKSCSGCCMCAIICPDAAIEVFNTD